MRAVVLTTLGGPLETAEVDDPTPGPGEVVVTVDSCGICGSDLHLVDALPMPGLVLGYEVAGRVAAVGQGVDGWSEGDPVMALSLATCGRCEACRSGPYRKCASALMGVEAERLRRVRRGAGPRPGCAPGASAPPRRSPNLWPWPATRWARRPWRGVRAGHRRWARGPRRPPLVEPPRGRHRHRDRLRAATPAVPACSAPTWSSTRRRAISPGQLADAGVLRRPWSSVRGPAGPSTRPRRSLRSMAGWWSGSAWRTCFARTAIAKELDWRFAFCYCQADVNATVAATAMA